MIRGVAAKNIKARVWIWGHACVCGAHGAKLKACVIRGLLQSIKACVDFEGTQSF